jgi:hypothetical protein
VDYFQPPHAAPSVVGGKNVENDIQIQRILTLGAHWNSSPSPIPLSEGVIIPWVSPLELTSTRFVPTSTFPNVYWVYAQGLRCVRSDPRGVSLLEDAVRQEANHANNKRQRACKKRRALRSTTWEATRVRREETMSKSGSLGADE